MQDCDFHCHWSVGCIQVHSRVETSIHRVVDKHDRHGIEVLVIGEDIDFVEEVYKGNSHSVRCVVDLKGRAQVTSKQSKGKYAAKLKEARRVAKVIRKAEKEAEKERRKQEAKKALDEKKRAKASVLLKKKPIKSQVSRARSQNASLVSADCSSSLILNGNLSMHEEINEDIIT